MPTTEVTLYTSIQPQLKRPVRGRDFGPAWQRTCIGSWKAAGFRIVSLNAPAELEALRSLEPIVEFQQIAADRKRPTITDFFAAAANSANRVVGIINGDCLIIQQMNLVDRLSRGIDGIAIVEKLNIDQQTLRPSGRPCMGFDAFFFEPASLARVKHDSFWLLGGWWVDYWLPFAFHTAGLKIWTLPARSLIHLDHDIPRAWGEDWNNATLRLTDFLLNAGKQGLLDPTLTKNLSSAARKDDRAALLQLLFFWLRSQEPLWIPESGSAEELLTNMVNASATFPQPLPHVLFYKWKAIVRQQRNYLRLAMETLGLRRTFHMLGLVKRRETDVVRKL